jgi:MraZ protein
MKPINGFLGTHHLTLDEKGRINVPAKFRAVLEREENVNLVMVVMDRFLIVFPQHEWTANEAKMNNLSAFDREDRDRLREYYARAAECEMKSGKVLVPGTQRETAGLTREVVLVGMSKTFEIWSRDRWEAQASKSDGR